jgi:hypothetical protein
MKTKIAKLLLIPVLLGVLFVGCDWFSKSSDKPTDIGNGSYISTNPTDPKFVKYVSMKGEVVEVFGTRTSSGMPDKVLQINVTTASGELYSYFFDANKKLISTMAANGTIFKYDWLANNKVALTIVANDGKTQVNTELDLSGVKSAAVPVNEAQVKPRVTGRDCSDMLFTPYSFETVSSATGRLKAGSTAGTTYDLYTTQCGSPSNQSIVAVNLYDQSGSVKLGEVIPVWVGSGHYTITVPSGTAPAIDPQSAAEKLSSVLSTYCDAAGVLGAPQALMMSQGACAALAAKLALTVVGASVATPVGTACSGLSAAMAVYCKTLGASGDPGTPSIMDKINELKFLDYFKITANMRMHVVFLGLPNNITKGFTIAENVSGSLNAELDENGKPKIRSLDLVPSSPAAGVGYTITVSVYCLPVGSNVTLSMVGSDGYSKTSTFPITSAAQSAGKFSISIPGGAKGVKDDVTAKVTTSDGQTITSSASLIFGS